MNVAKPILAALAVATLAPVLPAEAAGSFTPPAGCQLFLTVQSRACRVSNHYKCEGDPAGDQWRADFDQEGMFFRSRIDRETQWIESYEDNPPVRQTLDANPTDPASFSELLATGKDSYDFNLSRDNGAQSRVTGYDRLTGKSFTIDGEPVEETEFDYTETDLSGNVLQRSRGNEYISRDMRMFFAGRSEWDAGEGTWLPMDGSPMKFIRAGQPGFGATQPIFDCDPVMSSLPQSLLPKG